MGSAFIFISLKTLTQTFGLLNFSIDVGDADCLKVQFDEMIVFPSIGVLGASWRLRSLRHDGLFDDFFSTRLAFYDSLELLLLHILFLNFYCVPLSVRELQFMKNGSFPDVGVELYITVNFGPWAIRMTYLETSPVLQSVAVSGYRLLVDVNIPTSSILSCGCRGMSLLASLR